MSYNRRRRVRDEINNFKAEKGCSRCGESDPRVLQFHHSDPTEKDSKISRLIESASKDRLWAEIAKCEVVCANCHIKIHNPLN